MIPGWLISILTFPGTILHELAHKKFCDWLGVRVLEVRYFTTEAGGYVIHERPQTYAATFWVSVGPLIFNSLFCFLFGMATALFYEGAGFLFYLFGWLSISCGMHAFPSNQDAENILEESKKILKSSKNFFHYLSYPFFALIYIANALRFFWIDLIYAIAIIGIAFGVVGVAGSTSGYDINSNESGLYRVGEYLCSPTHYNKAETLEPSAEEKQVLDKLFWELENRGDYLETLEFEIRNTYVNEYSQSSVDSYNSKVNNYNYLLEKYNQDFSAYENRLETYNNKVKIYNNYLINNCREGL